MSGYSPGNVALSMEVTGQPAAHNIGYVAYRWILLTRRRAVDYCRVATALCP